MGGRGHAGNSNSTSNNGRASGDNGNADAGADGGRTHRQLEELRTHIRGIEAAMDRWSSSPDGTASPGASPRSSPRSRRRPESTDDDGDDDVSSWDAPPSASPAASPAASPRNAAASGTQQEEEGGEEEEEKRVRALRRQLALRSPAHLVTVPLAPGALGCFMTETTRNGRDVIMVEALSAHAQPGLVAGDIVVAANGVSLVDQDLALFEVLIKADGPRSMTLLRHGPGPSGVGQRKPAAAAAPAGASTEATQLCDRLGLPRSSCLVTLSPRPGPLGCFLSEEELGDHAAIVVDSLAPHAQPGFAAGDVLVSCNGTGLVGKSIEDFESLNAVAAAGSRRLVVLRPAPASPTTPQRRRAPAQQPAEWTDQQRQQQQQRGARRVPREPRATVYCLFDFAPSSADELALRAGDTVEVLRPQDHEGWVRVRLLPPDSRPMPAQTTGNVPLNFLAEDAQLRAFETVVMARRDVTPAAGDKAGLGRLTFRRGQYIIAEMDGRDGGSGAPHDSATAFGRLPDGSHGSFERAAVERVDV